MQMKYPEKHEFDMVTHRLKAVIVRAGVQIHFEQF